MIINVTRSIPAIHVTAEAKAAIVADVRAAIGELKCIGSERLVRLGVSMTQLHVMHMLERHGELPMSRLAEMLDVSLSAATGLVDRIEERGFVERIRVPNDRRIVLVRMTPSGQQMLDDVEVLRTEMMERILDRLDETQLAGVAAAMTDLRAAVAEILGGRDPGLAHIHQHHGRD